MDVESLLTEAIWEDRLAATAAELAGSAELDEPGRALAEAAVACCEAIGAHVWSERQRLEERLAAAGVASLDAGAGRRPAQMRAFEMRIAAADAPAAMAVAQEAGYRAGEDAGWLLRHRPAALLVKAAEPYAQLTLRWRDRGSWRARAGRALRRRPVPPAGLFLPTAAELVPLLLDFAGVTRHDVVLDAGCGDGRVVLEAARRYGCRARGVELDPTLADEARAGVAAAGLADLVTIEEGDVAAAALAGVTVVFAFLPGDRLADVVERLRPGMRLVAHEQSRVEEPRQPDVTRPIVGRASVTVGHLWRGR